jgi:hypothetical protein
MSINISDKPEMNVVNVGDELSVDMIDALNSAAYPNAVNSFVTISAGNSAYLEKDGGGTVVGTVVVDTDGTVGGNTTTVNGTSVEVSNYGIGTIKMDPVLGVTFPDGTSQGTAAVTTPDASTTVKGKVQLTTETEIREGQSTTSTPTTQSASLLAQYSALKRKGWNFASAPTGQSTGTGYSTNYLPTYGNVIGGANVAGFTRQYYPLFHPNPLARASVSFFNGKYAFGQGFYLVNTAATVGFTLISRLGVTNGPTAGVVIPENDTTTKWFGWKYVYGSSIKLQVYDGTTYQETDTGYTPTFTAFSQPVYIVCWSDGAGTAYIEITKPDGTTVTASQTGCPTGAATGATNQSWVLQLSGTGTQTGNTNLTALPVCFATDW